MSDIKSLSLEEKIFLAGAIKSMIMADGKIEEAELNELDKLRAEMDFNDFDTSLVAFEQQVAAEEDFWEMAEKIRDEAREVVLEVLYDLSLQSVATDPTEDEDHLIDKLKKKWQL